MLRFPHLAKRGDVFQDELSSSSLSLLSFKCRLDWSLVWFGQLRCVGNGKPGRVWVSGEFINSLLPVSPSAWGHVAYLYWISSVFVKHLYCICIAFVMYLWQECLCSCLREWLDFDSPPPPLHGRRLNSISKSSSSWTELVVWWWRWRWWQAMATVGGGWHRWQLFLRRTISAQLSNKLSSSGSDDNRDDENDDFNRTTIIAQLSNKLSS